MQARPWRTKLIMMAIAGLLVQNAYGAGAKSTGKSPMAGDCPLNPMSSRVIDVKHPPYNAKGNGIEDDTDAIQDAVNSARGGDTVLIPPGTYKVKAYRSGKAYGIRLKSDMTLRMASGAVLKATPTDSENYSIVMIAEASNVNVIGGVLEGERGSHRGTGGEWGMGLNIKQSNHVVVEGVTARECWGDGFYVCGGSKDVTLCRITADSNRRQGISIVSADGVVVRNSTFKNTAGTLPECGLDLEPNQGEVVKNVTITGNTFTGNSGGGIAAGQRSGSIIADIIIDGNKIIGNGANPANGTRGIWIVGASGMNIRNNLIQDNRGIGIQVTDGARNITITRNTITGTLAKSIPRKYGGGEGIQLYKVEGNHVSGNTLSGNQGPNIQDAAPSGTNSID